MAKGYMMILYAKLLGVIRETYLIINLCFNQCFFIQNNSTVLYHPHKEQTVGGHPAKIKRFGANISGEHTNKGHVEIERERKKKRECEGEDF